MAEEELELDVNKEKGSKTTTILLIVLIVLVLVMGGVGAWLFLGKDSSDKSPDSAEKAKKELAPLSYLTLVPEFIVNFGPGSKVRYLQVDLQVATRDKTALKTVGMYRPVLRNDILIVLSGVSFDDLKDRSGKEALQKKLLNTINKVVISAGHAVPQSENDDENTTEKSTEHVDPDAPVEGPIENVYFTSFIMQ